MTKGHQETQKMDMYVYYLDCGCGFMGVPYVKTYIVCQLYLNKAAKNIKRKGCTISAHLKLIYAAFDLYNIKK